LTLRAHLAVAAAAVLFGTTFFVVKDAVADVEPVPFLAVRFLIAAAVLWPFARRTPARPGGLRAGVLCGIALAAGYVFQTTGLQFTTGSESAFITYLLVVFVPVLAAVWLRRLPSLTTMAGVVLAFAGLFLLTGGRLSAIGKGELLTLGCAVAFAVHIVLLAQVAPLFATLRLSATQLVVVGAVCLVPGFFMGGYHFTTRAWAAAVYTAVASSAVAFALQVWGQKRVGPTRTSLLLMIEPVSAALIGVIAGDHLGAVGAAGAVLILVGIAVSELGPLVRARTRSSSSLAIAQVRE
jgi:drug/metabolite transporter (DMT)-like permease